MSERDQKLFPDGRPALTAMGVQNGERRRRKRILSVQAMAVANMRPRYQVAPLVVLHLLGTSSSSNAFQATSGVFSGLRRWSSSPVFVSSAQSADDLSTPSKNQRRQERRELIAIRRREVTKLEDEERDKQDRLLLLAVAVLPTILAFVSWDGISHGVANFLDVHGRPAESDDTGLLLTTMTGVLVPVISIALATLVSTTVNVLRDRQLQLRALVNKEACQIRLLRRSVFGMFGTRQHAGRRARAMALLASYVDEIILETNVGAVDALEELELSGGIAKNELDCISSMIHGVDGASATRQESVGVAEGSIVSLNEHRSDRVALILSVFPTAHWLVMIALTLTNIMAFLVASNQQPNHYFSSSFQLQLMYTTLVGVCAVTAMLCLDLADPFRGSFSLAQASTQFGDLRAILREDVTEAIEEGKDTPAATFNVVRSYLSGPSSFGIDTNDLVLSKWVSDTYLKVGAEYGVFGKDEIPDDEDRIDASSLLTGKVGNVENLEERSMLKSSQSRYGLLPTLYFHLLKGPLGSQIRAFGDIVAWTSAFVARRISATSRFVKRLSRRPRSRKVNSG